MMKSYHHTPATQDGKNDLLGGALNEDELQTETNIASSEIFQKGGITNH